MTLSKVSKIISLTIILGLITAYFFHPISNLVGDLGYYLKTGEIIVTNGIIPSTNLFSYTNPNFPFINSNWLSEVIFYLNYHIFAGYGLILLSIFLAVTSFAILLKVVVGKISIIPVLIISLIYIQILFERTDIKPELFSFLMLSIFLFLLYKFRVKYTRLIYLLIPLQMLWTNLHIFFFLGIVTIGLFVLDELITSRGEIRSSKLKTLITIFFGSIAATLLNPNFITGALYPLFVMQNYGFKVEENIGFLSAINSYSDTTFLFFEIGIAFLWVGLLFVGKKLKPIDILLSIFFSAIALLAVRAFPLFVIGTYIPAVKILSEINLYIRKKVSIKYLELSFLIVFLLLLIPSVKQNIDIHGFGFGVIDNAKDSVSFLKDNSINGPIFNNYDIGNYLDFRLYPQVKVFVDARPEAYPKSFFDNTYFPMENSESVFNQMAVKYRFETVILAHTDTSPSGTQFLANITKDPSWKMVYLNNTVVIFFKNNVANKELINKYLINSGKVHLRASDLNNKNNVRQLVNFFRAVGWEKEWLAMNLKYLEYEPNNCGALQNIAYIYQKEQNAKTSFYVNKFLQSCK